MSEMLTKLRAKANRARPMGSPALEALVESMSQTQRERFEAALEERVG